MSTKVTPQTPIVSAVLVVEMQEIGNFEGKRKLCVSSYLDECSTANPHYSYRAYVKLTTVKLLRTFFG